MDSALPQKVLILGSTGSIGSQTLDIARQHPEAIEVVGLACGSRASSMLAQAREFGVDRFVVGEGSHDSEAAVEELSKIAKDSDDGFFGIGQDGIRQLIEGSDADIVVNSLVGAAGLKASIKTLESGKRLALANKESLVVGGDIIMPLAAKMDSLRSGSELDESAPYFPAGSLVPIDSEHGAIFQCLLGEKLSDVSKLWVTASGGPFRGKTIDELASVRASDALKHPTWNMGPKITIDSSTLMNKGLEVIEAHHLFQMPYEKIEVVVQPQSAIHSMVEFSDGSVKAHLGTTDMRIPIQFALSYPNRWDAPVSALDFRKLGSLEFADPDTDTFKCLALAKEAGKRGGTLPCAMNAANEVAVDRFLNDRCGFLDIQNCVSEVMSKHDVQAADSVEVLEDVDAWARRAASDILDR